MTASGPYDRYWTRKRLLAGPTPRFDVRRWWRTDALCESERIIFDAVRGAASLLDVGAGDLTMMRKLCQAGYAGEYHTLDVSTESTYTYRTVDDVRRRYGGIICLDVLEHLSLTEGLQLLLRLGDLLEPGGTLVVQTANARCVRHPLSWDMTHLHCYNIHDLWAEFVSRGFAVTAYRVVLSPTRWTPAAYIRSAVGAFVTTQLLGLDYADNILLIAKRDKHARDQATG